MILQGAYFIYFVFLIIYIIVFGFNYYRIQFKWKIHPQVITYLIPFMFNFFAAKFMFQRLNSFMTMLLPCLIIYFLGRKIQQIRIFGLTGGIASGKSTLVTLMKQALNDELHVIDCDAINKQLSLKGNPGYLLILNLLGDKRQQFLVPGSKDLNRQKLSDFVFKNPDFRRKLTNQMGRKIFLQIFKQIYECMSSKKKLIMIDAPILFETKILEYICFPVIVIGCSHEIQVQRLMDTRGMTELQANIRIKSQMPLSEKKKKADIYIENSGTPNEMFNNTLKKLNKILSVKKR